MAKILVVDDSVSMRQMLSYVLSEDGHEVTDTGCAEDALTKAGSSGFELVISDLNMPGMSGIELAKELRSMPAFNATPILILSTDSSQEMKTRGKAAGVNGWITKPFNPQMLQQVVKQVTN